MRKLVGWIGGILAGLVILGALVITIFPGPILQAALEDFGEQITSTNVVIDEVEGSIWRGQFVIGNLRVHNPPSFSDNWLLTAENARVKMNPLSLVLGDRVTVHSIVIDNPAILYEAPDAGSNFDALHNKDSDKKEDEKKDKDKHGGKGPLLIESFTMTNAEVEGDLKGVNPVSMTIDTLSVQDAGKDQKAVDAILDRLKAAVVDKALSGKIFDLIGEALDDDDPVMQNLQKAGKHYKDSLSEGALKNLDND